MKCPRCNVDLILEQGYHGIEVDRCPSCDGRWLDHDELDQMEATIPSTPEERRATIQFAKKKSELHCPKCGKGMTAFNYRAYNLELDTCEDEHGFWLDAGEEARVGEIIQERVRGLARAVSAEAAWGRFLGGLRGRGGLFRRR